MTSLGLPQTAVKVFCFTFLSSQKYKDHGKSIFGKKNIYIYRKINLHPNVCVLR